MKSTILKRKRNSKREMNKKKMKGSLARHLSVQLGQISFKPPIHSNNNNKFQKLLEEDESARTVTESVPSTSSFPSVKVLDFDVDVDLNVDDKDFILSQDFFW